jgi:hypothetical protein
MKRSMTFILFTVTIWIVPILSGIAEQEQRPKLIPAGRSKTQWRRALAVISVTRAALEIANERPVLPDTRPRNVAAPTPDDVKPESETRQHESLPPMRIDFLKSSTFHEVLPAQLVVGHWRSGCPAGDRQERDIRRILTPLGWTIGNAITDQIQIIHISQDFPCPQITLYQNGSILKGWQGYQDPSFLSQELRKAWDSAPNSKQNVAMAGGAGVIHARTQIHQALDWWKTYLGEHTKASLNWDRTGAQAFPLLAKGNWSVEALFGKSGRIEASAIGATSLPIDSLGFGYRVIGGDISIDIDPVVLKGFARKFAQGVEQNDHSMQADEPHEGLLSRIGPMTIWTIATVIRDLFSLLHPTCDLQLGGNVSATGELSGKMLAIDFQQAPSIKLVALFTFQLSVKRVEITEESVRLVFAGSRIVKERTFQVQ